MLKMANDKRLGDVGLIIVILAFVLTTVSFIFSSFDSNVGVVTLTSTNINSLSSEANNQSHLFEVYFTNSTDKANKLSVDKDQQLDDRFGSSSGITNVYSKNMFVRFFQLLGDTIPDAKFIFIFLLSLSAVFISILIIRSFLGDGRW